MQRPVRQAQGKPKIIAIVGPTSSGKSSLGIFLARKVEGEIISADSRQVYKGLDIGTGKVTKKEMAGVPHYLLDVASPKRIFTVSDFKKHGERAIKKILKNGNIPIIVGGTGLYVDVLLGRISVPEVPPNPALRARLEKKSVEKLFAMLQKKDPARAANIEPHHKRRLIRALEVAEFRLRHSPAARALRAARPSLTLALGEAASPYSILWLGLNPGEKNLHKNIHTRLHARLKAGMIAEAVRLHAQGLSYKRMGALGLEYRYLAYYLQNKISRAKMEEQLERAIQKYAKRQMRWFKRNPEVRWINHSPVSRAGKAETLGLTKKFLGGR